MKRLLLLITLSLTALYAQEASYIITGEKDPRLDALYMVTYVSQNLKDDACSYKEKNIGYRRPMISSRNIAVADGNYTIKLPIILTEDENNCNYRFSGLLLIMKRKYDEELSSIHYILSDKQEVNPIYYKTARGSMGGDTPTTPPYLYTDKKYFRIAEQSTFLCKTYWFPEDEYMQFHCTMQIDDDVNRTGYTKKRKIAVYTHPEFGVDSIEDTEMKIDILVDEKECKAYLGRDNINAQDHFREVKPSIWQKLF